METNFKTVNAEEFAKDIKSSDIYLIDVRAADEFNDGHIAGAHNLDVEAPDFMEKAKSSLPQNKTIAVYCRSGKRSAKASAELANAGYKILNLDGGITSWMADELPVVK